MRPARGAFQPGYFCADHRSHGDVPIPVEGEFRRVRLTLEVWLAGASWMPAEAEAEAEARLQLAIARAGGISAAVACTSAIVPWEGRAPVAEAAGILGKP